MSSSECSSATGAAKAIATFAGDEFERIAALSETLLELMKQPRFYASPLLAAAQLATIRDAAEAASASVDQMAETIGILRERPDQQALLDALAVFRRGHTY